MKYLLLALPLLVGCPSMGTEDDLLVRIEQELFLAAGDLEAASQLTAADPELSGLLHEIAEAVTILDNEIKEELAGVGERDDLLAALRIALDTSTQLVAKYSEAEELDPVIILAIFFADTALRRIEFYASQ